MNQSHISAATLVLLGHALLWLLFDTGPRVATSKPAGELIRLRLIAEPLRPLPTPRARIALPAAHTVALKKLLEQTKDKQRQEALQKALEGVRKAP